MAGLNQAGSEVGGARSGGRKPWGTWGWNESTRGVLKKPRWIDNRITRPTMSRITRLRFLAGVVFEPVSTWGLAL